MSEPVIAIRNLVKRYGRVEALRKVSVDVPPGPVGLLGPNGAGKTTLIKLLLGLLEPTEGEAMIAGCDPSKKADRIEVRKRIGYMPEGDCLLPNTTGVELVTTLGRLTGLTRDDALARTHEVLDYVELDEARYRPVNEFSTGMKQRMKLAQALVHDPEILLLDEPTNGLDPKGRREMLALIDDLGRKQGKNILLCSHLLHDVELTCDHVLVMNKGEVVETGNVAEMTKEDGLSLTVTVDGDAALLRKTLVASGLGVEDRGDKLLVQLGPEAEDADQVFLAAAEAGVALTGVEPVKSSLEQVFLRAVGATAGVATEQTKEELA
ncbi:MAG: ABC transporter ATP-binding protein [Planctomycetota bacterium]|nr:ABC transporter ATP-binding protein [Planctomycetota bacterium]